MHMFMRLKYEFKWFSAYILEIQSRLATETIAEWIACKTKRPTFVKQWHLFSTATCTCILFLKLMSYPFHLPYAHQQRHNVFESVACVQYCVFAFVSFICGGFEVVVLCWDLWLEALLCCHTKTYLFKITWFFFLHFCPFASYNNTAWKHI